MNNYDIDQTAKPRLIERNGDTRGTLGTLAGTRNSKGLFSGWGPRLLSISAAAIGICMASGTAQAENAADPTSLTCAVPQRDAEIISNPIPEAPQISRYMGALDGDAVLRIELSAQGELEKVSIDTSSGNPVLDKEALRVARETKYAPAISNCENVASSYLYTVSFGS